MKQQSSVKRRSKHFRLQQLAEGVYAAIHIGGGAAIGNAGIIDLGGRTLIFDTFFTPQAGADLRAAAEELTGRPVDVVVDSHYHNDHIWGNQVFGPDTDIISSVETRRLIIATQGHDDYDSFRDSAAANLESTRAAFHAAQDERERRQLAVWLDYHGSFVEAEPTLQVRPPNVTFTRRMALHGTDRSAELIDYAGGHCASDVVLYLPQDGIAYMGDLLFIGYHPWLGCGDPDRVLQILEEVADLEPELLVPGHGPIGTPDSLRQMRQFICTLDELAGELVEGSVSEAKFDEIAIPEPYDDWLFASFFPSNMHFLYQRQARQKRERLPIVHRIGGDD
jgi:cyclase